MALASFSLVASLGPEAAKTQENGWDFSDVYRTNFAFVWRAAKRLGVQEAHQDDVVQEVFVVVHRRLDTFEGRSRLRTWLYGITIRVVRDYRKSRARRDEPTGIDFDALTATENAGCPARELERVQAARILQAILEAMDDEKREVFVLSELEQLTIPEVSEVLAVNVNTAYARLRAAKQFFDAAVTRFRAAEPRGAR